MEIKQLVVRDCDIPFNLAFRQSSNARNSSQGLLVEILTEKGTLGYGECLPRDYVSGETPESVVAALKSISRNIVGKQFNRLEEVVTWSTQIAAQLKAEGHGTSCARCAVELSVLDALGKETRQPVLTMLGKPRAKQIRYSGIMAWSSSKHNDLVLAFLKKMEIHQVKIKVGMDQSADLDLIRKVRSYIGAEADIRVDCNGAWSLDNALEMIPLLAREGVRAVEQPLHHEDRHHYPALMAELTSTVTIWIDESVCTLEDAKWIAEHHGAHGINLKISKNGGLLNSIAIATYARKRGLTCQLGAQVGETSLITAAGRILAALDGHFSYHEGAFGEYLLDHDIIDQPLGFGPQGRASLNHLLDHPGIGVIVNPEIVNKMEILCLLKG